ncbi:MAG: hypothetical protein H0U13_12330, partial [Gemmatimonadaceae bacterium]|nr:hypothetical protein [Gemmatimonadaceae bacterium]
GPAALRDSVRAAQVRRQREDSIRRAGGDTAQRRPGRQGAPGAVPGEEELNLRPAEAPLRAGPAGGPGGGGAGGGGGGRGGPGGQRTGPPVAEGDYLVTITAGGQTMRRTIHVERTGQLPPDPFPESEEEREQ